MEYISCHTLWISIVKNKNAWSAAHVKCSHAMQNEVHATQRNTLSCTITKVWIILITQWSLSDYNVSYAENLMIGSHCVVKSTDSSIDKVIRMSVTCNWSGEKVKLYQGTHSTLNKWYHSGEATIQKYSYLCHFLISQILELDNGWTYSVYKKYNMGSPVLTLFARLLWVNDSNIKYNFILTVHKPFNSFHDDNIIQNITKNTVMLLC